MVRPRWLAALLVGVSFLLIALLQVYYDGRDVLHYMGYLIYSGYSFALSIVFGCVSDEYRQKKAKRYTTLCFWGISAIVAVAFFCLENMSAGISSLLGMFFIYLLGYRTA